MAPIVSDITVHLRTDRSVTQFMQENISNTAPDKIVYEDTLIGKTATYGGFRADVFRMAHTLRHRYGLQTGDIVSIICASCVDFVLASHAVWAAGGILSTINHSSTTQDLVHAIELVEPDFYIVQGALVERLQEAISLDQTQRTKRCPIFTLVTPVAELPHFPDHFLGHDNYVEPSAYVLDGQDARKVCASIVLSSGTTGAPKAVMLSHHNLASICEQLRAHIPENWRGSQREIFFPPLSHIYGIYCAILMPCWLGSYICLMPSFDLDLYCRLLQDRNATLARLVPTVALMLAESSVVENYSYPNLEYFSCSAAPLKQSVAAKLRRRFPGVHLCQTYGCTELSSAIAQSGVRDKDVPLVAAGTIIANVQIRFIDKHGVDVPPHKPGEICINSPSAMMGYKDNEAATRESFLEPGWYKTGDIGYLDSKGYLIIVDRIKEVIKYKGFQVNPGEIEEIISHHPHIEDVCVAAVWDDSQATEHPRAYVVARRGIAQHDIKKTAYEIRELVDSKVSGYKKLRGGVLFLEQLPRNPTGKILRRLLPSERKDAMAQGELTARL